MIKLLQKKDKDKRLIGNWRPISLINYDTKILTKVLAKRLKEVLPSLIKCDQTAYVKNRFLGESVRLISDVLDMTKTLNIEGFLMTVDIQKAFDSVDHKFLIACLRGMNFNEDFIDWIKVILNQQESCVLNGSQSTGYFPLQRGVRQGDPISAYLFIMVIEVFFTMVRKNPNIKGLDILGFKYLLTSYADDTTFFVKDKESALQIFNTFDLFSKYSGLKINKSKCEIAGIGVKNGVKIALLGAKCIDLNTQHIKILGVCFSYNEQIFVEKNFNEVVCKMEKVLATWRWRNLSLIGKVSVFKTLAFSKIVFISYLNKVPPKIVEEIEQIQGEFIWEGRRKVKHNSFIADYADGGLKDVDVKSKFESLNLSWVRRLYDENFHPWKNIPIKLLNDQFRHNIFYPNIQIELKSIFPSFYLEIAKNWSNLLQEPITSGTVKMQAIWYNNFIKIRNKPIKKMFDFELFIGDLFRGKQLYEWNVFKEKYKLKNKDFFKWRQIIDAIPKKWKKLIRTDNIVENFEKKQHLLHLTRPIPIEKLTSKYFYILKLLMKKELPTSQANILSKLNETELNWRDIYLNARKCTVDNYGRAFHFKTVHNFLYLNETLSKMENHEAFKSSPLCSYCKERNETIIHLFAECKITKVLWNRLNQKISIDLPALTPKSAYCGFFENRSMIINHILLIFKIALFKNRDSGACSLTYITNKILQIKETEENIVYINPNAKSKNNEKWAGLEIA